MGSWFQSKKQDRQQTQPMSGLRVQSSIEGKPIPRGWGQARVAGNLIWYGDFSAVAIQQKSGGGGKGGGATGGGGKGQQGNVQYSYYTSFALGVCEGPIASIDRAWVNKSVGNIPAQFALEVFNGDYAQLPWGYLSTAHPDQALNYRGLAYVAQAGLFLGSSAELPNYSFEVTFDISWATDDIPDANPRDVVVDFLTNPYAGVPSWPSGRLASLDNYADACQAAGLFVSPIITEQAEASSFLTALLAATNATARWSSGMLDIVPWFDEPITGNGVTYTPDVTPEFDLVNDDFLPSDGDGQPIQSKRRPPNERTNALTLEYLSRDDAYDPVVVDAKDQASIQQYGLRPSDVRNAHMICLGDAARLSAYLQLAREQIPNTYSFTLGARFIMLDVEDIVTLTRPEMSMYRQAVRIIEITENDDGSLSMEAEEFNGTVGAPRYGRQATEGYEPNTNVDPGGINDPIIFEPTDQLGAVDSPLGGGLQVWAAISGVDTALWGGCNIYASYDGVTFSYVGDVKGPARMGVTTAPLPAFGVNPTGPNVDETNTLAVDLSMSASSLLSGTTDDALGLNTASYVGGEIIAYRDATLTGPNAYDLDYLVRGAYGTEGAMIAGAKPAGTKFARLDQGIFKMPYDQSRIGSTIYLKFQSFNIWGGGLQDIADVPAYTYELTGEAMVSPLPDVQNLRDAYTDGFMELSWDEVTDFRSGIRYKIFEGATYEGAVQRADQAHPPFKFQGSGTFWVIAYCQPVPGRYVYSENATSRAVVGNMLTENVVITSNQKADGWLGTFTNMGMEGIPPNAIIRLSGADDILADPDVLVNPDILNAGGIVASGYYTIPAADRINLGRVGDIYLNATWSIAGSPVGGDILTEPDVLAMPDVLGSESTQYVDGWIEVRTSDDGVTWSDWQKYMPGVFHTNWIDLRFGLSTVNPAVIAYGLEFTFTASVPARIDHYQAMTVTGAGLTITFEPDDASTPAPFNGGPLVGGVNNTTLPFYQFTWPNQAGDVLVIDSLTLSNCVFHIENAGLPVTRTNVNATFEGY